MTERKISEALPEFAVPILSLFEGEFSPERIQQTFIVAITAWNAVILDQSEKATNFLEQTRDRLGQPQTEPTAQGLYPTSGLA